MTNRVSIILSASGVRAALLNYHKGGWVSVEGEHATCQVSADIPITVNHETDIAALAETISDAVKTIGGESLPVDLVIPSSWCFINKLPSSSKRFSETTATFQFEEYVPIPLEELTITFMHNGEGDIWGLAVLTKPFKELFEALEKLGVFIEHLRVDLCTALSAINEHADKITGIVVTDTHRFGLAIRTAKNKQPVAIRNVLVSSDDCLPEIVQRNTVFTESTLGLEVDFWFFCNLDTQINVDHSVNPEWKPVSLDRLHATAAVEDSTQPDLRVGDLAAANRYDKCTRHAIRVIGLLVILFLVLMGLSYQQHSSLQKQIADLQNEQAAIFKKVLPSSKIPTSPAMRLASEKRRLEGLTGTSNIAKPEEAEILSRSGPLDDLVLFVEQLPLNVRIGIQELNIDQQQLTIRGQTTDHRDAERIAEVVNRIPSVHAPPPRTSRIKTGGVEFTIRAKRSEDGE